MRAVATVLAVAIAGLPACQKAEIETGSALPSTMRDPARSGGPLARGAPAGPAEVRVSIVAPDADAVLVPAPAPELKARIASVVPGSDEAAADPIDPATVRFFLVRPMDREALVKGTLTGPGPDGLYSARLDLSAVETGGYVVQVDASTRGGRRGMDLRNVLVDRGPKIRILSPREGQSVKGRVTVQAQVDYAPFEPMGEAAATLANQPLALRQIAAGLHEAIVELIKYEPPLVGEQLLKVTAQNSKGTRTEAVVKFVVDVVGPTFVSTEPPPGSVVGNVIRVRAKLEDPAGVLGTTVMAIIGHKGADTSFNLELKPEAPGTFSAFFDTKRLDTCGAPKPDSSLCNVFPSISFRAADQLGNETTVAYDLHVDNQPPVIELDPAPIRLLRFDPNLNGFLCSRTFKPNGNYIDERDMPYDLCGVPQAFDLRAWAEDAGNRARALRGTPISVIDPATVAAYVQPDTGQPLVVDTDNDGICDAINPKLVPTTRGPFASNQVLKVRLKGLGPKGEPDFGITEGLPMGCANPTDKTKALPAARPLCAAHAVPRNTLALGYPDPVKGPHPATWGLEPETMGDPWCFGSQFDGFANAVGENRWVCLTVAAADNVGNHGVASPLRLWIDFRGTNLVREKADECPRPPRNAPAPPSCTGSYDRATDTVSARPCRSLRFTFPNERREIFTETPAEK
jgi:hypothetical protein